MRGVLIMPELLTKMRPTGRRPATPGQHQLQPVRMPVSAQPRPHTGQPRTSPGQNMANPSR